MLGPSDFCVLHDISVPCCALQPLYAHLPFLGSSILGTCVCVRVRVLLLLLPKGNGQDGLAHGKMLAGWAVCLSVCCV